LSKGLSHLDRFVEHLRSERRLAARTQRLYAEACQKLVEATGKADLDALTPAEVRRALAHLHGQGMQASSLARTLSAWRQYYRWRLREGALLANPCKGLRAPKRARGLPHVLSPDQAVALVAQPIDPANPAELRDRAVFELLYSSGVRISELTCLDLGSVDMATGEARVTGKGGKTRIVPVGSHALAALRAWLDARPQGPTTDPDALFVSARGRRLGNATVRAAIKRWARRAGIDGRVYPHMLRHSFASHVLQSSQDLRAVQEMLGHASIASTQVYTHLDFQHLARTYDAAHPRAKRKQPAQ
jgi:integrase/recombinase XerC